MKDSEKFCEYCRYCEFRFNKTDNTLIEAICYRKPPVPIYYPEEDTTLGVFPTVEPTDWCGEFETTEQA